MWKHVNCRLFHPAMIWFQWSEQTEHSWKQNYQSKLSLLQRLNLWPWLQSEGGEGRRGVESGNPDCIITFSIYYSTSPVSRGGIAVAISESRKIALKMYMTQHIFSNCCWWEALGAGVGCNCRMLQCGLTFPHVNQPFFTLKKGCL